MGANSNELYDKTLVDEESIKAHQSSLPAGFDSEAKQEFLEMTKTLSKVEIPVHTFVVRDFQSTLNELVWTFDPFNVKCGIPAVLEEHVAFGVTKNYCPVALNQDKVLYPGKKEFAVEYNGKVFLLSSDRYKQEFMSNPTQFLEARITPPRIAVIGATGAGKVPLF